MDESRYSEVRDLLAKIGLSKAAIAELLGVGDGTLAGWSRGYGRAIPADKLILLRAAGAGVPLPQRVALYPRLVEKGSRLAEGGTRPSTPEELLAVTLHERRAETTLRTVDAEVAAVLELLAAYPWRWRRQLLAPLSLPGPALVVEWDGRGQQSGQRFLALAVESLPRRFSLRLVVEDLVRQRPPAVLPQKAEVDCEALAALPAEDVAAEAAALLACGLPHGLAGSPTWWLMQMALLAMAQAV